jgi:hypothetical protein
MANTFYVICIVHMINETNALKRNFEAFEKALNWSKTKNNKELNEWLDIIQLTTEKFEELTKLVPP